VKPPNGSAGKLWDARASPNRQLGRRHADNQQRRVALINRGGDASELAIVLTNLDLAHAAKMLLTIADTNYAVHCVVAAFDLP
jgi:hypothetical protein